MRIIILILLINFASIAYANNFFLGSAGNKLEGKVISEFNKPWAMSFINEDKLLITTKAGKLWLVDRSGEQSLVCLLYTSPSPRDRQKSRMPSSA